MVIIHKHVEMLQRRITSSQCREQISFAASWNRTFIFIGSNVTQRRDKIAQETLKSLQKFGPPDQKNQAFFVEVFLWSLFRACEDLCWNHDKSTPYRSQTMTFYDEALGQKCSFRKKRIVFFFKKCCVFMLQVLSLFGRNVGIALAFVVQPGSCWGRFPNVREAAARAKPTCRDSYVPRACSDIPLAFSVRRVALAGTELLFDAVLGEFAAVACCQPRLIIGDFNVEPKLIPCLMKGIRSRALG